MKSTLHRIEKSEAARFPEIHRLGGDAGWEAFLGYRPGDREPAILLVQAGERGEEHRREVFAHLDSGLPVGRTTCPRCKAGQAGWPRFCGVCRTDLAPGSGDSQAELSVSRDYRYLGALRRTEGGGPLHFVLQKATGRVIGMAELPGAGGAVDVVPVWSASTVRRSRGWMVVAAVATAAAAAALWLPGVMDRRDSRVAADVRGDSIAADTGALDRAPEAPVVVRPVQAAADSAPAGPSANQSGGEPLRPPGSPVGGNTGKDEKGGRPPSPAAPPPAPTPQGVEAAVAAYASAVASGRTSRIARVYQGITAAEVERWNRFFAPLGPRPGLRTEYEIVSGPNLTGTRAEVIFTLTLSYTDAAGAPAQQSMPLRALLQWTGTAWSLREVRLLQ